MDVAYSITENECNGETYLELTVADIRPTAAATGAADVLAPAARRLP